MIVFKFNYILMVSVFILSLKELNAMPNPEEVQADQQKCLEELSELFPVDDVRENTKIAFNHLIWIDDETCHDTRNQTDYTDSIPKLEDSCIIYNGLTKEICNEILSKVFGISIYNVIVNSLYNLSRRSLDVVFEIYMDQINQLRANQGYTPAIVILPNIVIRYWDVMLGNFQLDINDDGVQGMPTKKGYCELQNSMT